MLIAGINLLLTFTDCYEARWERKPDNRLLRQMANKIAWNIWQMDVLKKLKERENGQENSAR